MTRRAIATILGVGIALLGMIFTVGSSGFFASLVFWVIVALVIIGFGSGR